MFKELKVEQVGKLVINCFNYLNQEDLLEMDPLENILFVYTITPVLDFNAKKYSEKCERNRAVGQKGGRPKKQQEEIVSLIESETQNNPVGLLKTQENLDGYLDNPENPKEKDKGIDRDKDRVIDKASDIGNGKERANVREGDIINEKEKILIPDSKKELEIKFYDLFALDYMKIEDQELNKFQFKIKMVVAEIGWNTFFRMILYSSEDQFLELLEPINIIGIKDCLKIIRNQYELFIK